MLNALNKTLKEIMRQKDKQNNTEKQNEHKKHHFNYYETPVHELKNNYSSQQDISLISRRIDIIEDKLN